MGKVKAVNGKMFTFNYDILDRFKYDGIFLVTT